MGAYFSLRPPAGYYSLSQRLGGTGPEGPAFLIHSHVWLGVGAPDQLQHEWYRSAPFLVPEPDPSHGEEEGSGHVPTIELSSQNAIIIVINHTYNHSQPACCFC